MFAYKKPKLGKMQNKSGAETNMLGKTQNKSGKTETLNHPIVNVLHKQQGLQSCLDRTIIAVIEYADKIYIGTNGIINVPTQCPRSGCTINQGYALCRTVCLQPYHAEESAIIDWLIDCGNEHDATISVYGAKAMCERCKALCEHYKLQVVKVTPDLMEFNERVGKMAKNLKEMPEFGNS